MIYLGVKVKDWQSVDIHFLCGIPCCLAFSKAFNGLQDMEIKLLFGNRDKKRKQCKAVGQSQMPEYA